MAPDLLIRPVRLEECQAVLDLWREAEATPSATDSLEEVQRAVGECGDLFLVAARDGRIVGTVIGGWDGWRGNISRLAVLPGCRREGIGRALVEQVTLFLFAKGARRISALVEHEHRQAVAFWDSLGRVGYERDARMTRYVRTLRVD